LAFAVLAIGLFALPDAYPLISGMHRYTDVECGKCHDKCCGCTCNIHKKHGNFIESAEASDLLEGGNEACVACHTSIDVHITWQHRGQHHGGNATVEDNTTVKE